MQMTTNYLIRLEVKFHNVVASLYWKILKTRNSFRSWYSLLHQATFFDMGVSWKLRWSAKLAILACVQYQPIQETQNFA